MFTLARAASAAGPAHGHERRNEVSGKGLKKRGGVPPSSPRRVPGRAGMSQERSQVATQKSPKTAWLHFGAPPLADRREPPHGIGLQLFQAMGGPTGGVRGASQNLAWVRGQTGSVSACSKRFSAGSRGELSARAFKPLLTQTRLQHSTGA